MGERHHPDWAPPPVSQDADDRPAWRPPHSAALRPLPVMASRRTAIPDSGRPGRALMTAIPDTLRHDLDQLLDTRASRACTWARWIAFRDQLDFHLAAESTAMWLPARARLAGHRRSQALLDVMENERQLIGPLRAVTGDAFTMGADPQRLRQLLVRLRTKLASHLAREEADAPPLTAAVMSRDELSTITRAIRGGYLMRRAARTTPWALGRASPSVRGQVLTELPATYHPLGLLDGVALPAPATPGRREARFASAGQEDRLPR